MILYFEFEERRRKAEVTWPKDQGDILVQLNDKDLVRQLPPDLYFEIKNGNKVSFIVENPDDKRLLQLQNTISKRLQELVN